MKLSTFDLFKKMPPGADEAELSNEELTALQNTLFEILSDIKKVCEQHNLCYFLVGGSAIGALRHGGFIPWDDDLDICMPRADYNKFVPLFQNEFKNKYYVETPENTKGYLLLLTKVRKLGTVLRGRDDLSAERCGIGVDVFVVENTPNNAFLRKLHGFGSMALSYILSCRKFYKYKKQMLCYASRVEGAEKVFKRKIRIGFVAAAFGNINFWRRLANGWNKLCKNNNSTYVTPAAGSFGYFKETYKRSEFCKTRTEVFCGADVEVPVGAEKYLTRCYGDWQTVPPVEKREKHFVLEFKA